MDFQAVTQRLQTRHRDLLACVEPAFDGMDVDGGTIQSLALTHGLLSQTTYDPEKHGPSMEAEPGDEWYVLAGPLALVEQEKGDA